MNGIINIYKEKGYTSFDVVAKLRGILHMRKIGHTGTLDPQAEGVLLVCFGKATGICGMLTDWDKTYETVMLLGCETDTQDTTGNILSKSEVNLTKKEIIECIESFVGEYSQVPPMYSALKVNGKKLYEFARKGIEIERKARKVKINSIRIHEIDLDENTVRMTVRCSKGTYIRTLCDDIGKKLGCKACMKELKRSAVGEIDYKSAVTLGQVQAKALLGNVEDLIIPIDKMFENCAKVHMTDEFDTKLHNGNKILVEDIKKEVGDVEFPFGANVRLYDSSDKFVGIYEVRDELAYPVKMFFDSEDR